LALSLKKVYKKFIISSTNHIIIDCFINNVRGQFILDTGASNSCIDYNKSDYFNLTLEPSNESASSATNKIKSIYLSRNNHLKIGDWKSKSYEFFVFDMNYIKTIFSDEENTNVDGIIGSDLLIKNNAKIDYEKKKIELEL